MRSDAGKPRGSYKDKWIKQGFIAGFLNGYAEGKKEGFLLGLWTGLRIGISTKLGLNKNK